MFEDTKVARENDAFLIKSNSQDFTIFIVIAIKAIKAKQSQAASKLAEVEINHKANRHSGDST